MRGSLPVTTFQQIRLRLAEIADRHAAIRTELSPLLDADGDVAVAETRGRAEALTTEAETLQAEEAELRANERRQLVLDDEARNAPGRPLDGGRERRLLPTLKPGEVIGLRPEQRMADFLGTPAEPLSLGRMVRGHLLGDWTDAQAERRAMGESTGSAGGFFVPGQVSAQTLDLMRNTTVLVRGGALTIPVGPGTTTVVKVVSDPTAQWRKEHEEIQESEGTYEPITIKPVSLAALIRVSVELLEDVPAFAGQIEGQIAAALGLEVDRVGLFGTGAASEPLGLYNVVGPTDIVLGANGAALADYDAWLDAIAALRSVNATPSATVFSPRTERALSGLVTGITGDKTKLVPPAAFTALTRLVSNQVSNTLTQGTAANASVAFVGDFSQVAIAVRSGLIIEASRDAGTAFAQAQVLVRALLRCDIAHLRPTHFARIKGIIPS
jgi:HK97 family phage major capsid protein